MKIAEIINKFWNKFLVPLHTAREMQMKGQIDDFKTIETEWAKNIEAPQTQTEFEQAVTIKKK